MTARQATYAEHLLPGTSTPLERALSSATLPLEQVPIPLRHLWRVDTCPETHLDALAWTLSVDIWDKAWPPAKKRSVIAASMEIHRHKGTVGALKRALAALGYQGTVEEWFEYDGDPYTFRLTVDVGETGLSPVDFDLLRTVVIRTKNVRSWFAGFLWQQTVGGPLNPVGLRAAVAVPIITTTLAIEPETFGGA